MSEYLEYLSKKTSNANKTQHSDSITGNDHLPRLKNQNLINNNNNNNNDNG